jgi:endonuclease/exonuclease/phosphatase family metal-dependent hydrolase
MNIGSFNVKNNRRKKTNLSKAKKIFELVTTYDIEILGLQEVTKGLLEELKNLFEPKGYTIVEAFRGKNTNSMNNESNTIVSKYKVKSNKVLWLSKKADVIVKRGFFTIYPRNVNISRINVEGTIISFVNVHLDIFKHARRKQLEKLYDILLEESKDYPVVLFGDFNVTNDREYFVQFCKKLENIGIKHILNEKETFIATKYHHFKGPIDHMFIPNNYELDTLEIIDTGISDHRMVVGNIKTGYKFIK